MSDTTINPQPSTPQMPPAQPQQDTSYDTQNIPPAQNPAAAPAPAPTPQQPHWLSRALDAVLKGSTGGDVNYVDPTGKTQVAPQSRASLGKTLIAATLAGVLSKDEYRQTSYGPVRDFTGTAGNALAASQDVVNAARRQPQKLSDDAQTRKLMTIQNTSQLIALRSAAAHMKHADQEQNAAAVETALSPFKEYESLRTSNNDPSQPKAFLAQGLTHDQVLAKGPDGKPAHNLTDSNVIQDGWIQKWDEDAQAMEPQPTYAVLNPDLKDVTLPKDVTDMLNKVNSQWKDIHQVVGGTVRVPVNAYISAMHDYSAVMQGQQVLEALNKTVNGEDAKPLTVDAVAQAARAGRDKGANILPALYSLTHAVAAGNLPDEGQRPDNLLHTLLTAPNSTELLSLIGLTPETAMKKADDINAERTKQLALAKLGGIGSKAPAPEGAAQQQIAMINGSSLDESEKQNLLAAIPESNGGQSTMGILQANSKTISSAIAAKNREDISAGDPAVLKQATNNIIEGDNSSLKDIIVSSNRNPTLRARVNNMLMQEAKDRGLDPTRYNLEAQQAKAETYKKYAEPDQKIGQQLQSFGKLLGHINDGYDASQAWARSGSPLFNKPIKWLAENAQNDQDFQRFNAAMIAPAKEYMNFLNQNRAEHESDIAAMKPITSGTASPATVVTILTELARTADIQAAQLGRGYIQTVGTTYPVVDPTGAAILDRLLGKGKSQAAAVSASIPKGWQNNQPSPISNPALLQTIFNAAGRDPQLATRIAKENGWIVPQQ